MAPKNLLIIAVTLAAPLLLILLSLAGCQSSRAPSVAPTVIAQPVLRCAPADAVILFLDRKFKEKPVYSGVFGNSIVLTVFVSDAGSFTVVHTGIANEISCLVSSGNNFKKLEWIEEERI